MRYLITIIHIPSNAKLRQHTQEAYKNLCYSVVPCSIKKRAEHVKKYTIYRYSGSDFCNSLATANAIFHEKVIESNDDSPAIAQLLFSFALRLSCNLHFTKCKSLFFVHVSVSFAKSPAAPGRCQHESFVFPIMLFSTIQIQVNLHRFGMEFD